jgi:hypothetical protein
MSQLNIHITPVFEETLEKFMRIRKIRTRSDAIRIAVAEALERTLPSQKPDFSSWLGCANTAPLNPAPRFGSEDDLWDGQSR